MSCSRSRAFRSTTLPRPAPHTLADELLRPSDVYATALGALGRAVDVRGLAHITGGGLPGNLSRILPGHCDAAVRRDSWEVPRIFGEIQRIGNVTDDEMARVFNLGIGMVAVVPPGDVLRAQDVLRSHGVASIEIGEVVTGEGDVRLT